MDSEQHEFERIYADDAAGVAEIVAFLHRNELNIDDFIEVFLAARNADGAIIACGGVAPGVIKCVAIDEEYRGCGMALSLSSALIQLAAERGYHRLFIYTKPENEALFSGCGFYPIATVPERVVLLENSPVRLKQYQQQLSALKKPGARIGSIVLNANPFTLGHLYLIETALQQCDWLHVFVVGEDRSQFSYADRLALVRAGTAHLSRLSIHEGIALYHLARHFSLLFPEARRHYFQMPYGIGFDDFPPLYRAAFGHYPPLCRQRALQRDHQLLQQTNAGLARFARNRCTAHPNGGNSPQAVSGRLYFRHQSARLFGRRRFCRHQTLCARVHLSVFNQPI
jgi:cytidyltransferase-like protein